MATQAMLDAARAAYHDLMLNGGLARIQHGTKVMEYKPADGPKLLAYISRLEGALGVPSSVRRTPARRVLF